MRKGITSREYNFLKHYIDIESPTFGNAYKSALQAGYTNTYARVIKKHFYPWRIKLIKNKLKKGDYIKIFKTFETIPDDIPVISERKMREIVRKNEAKLGTPSLKAITDELDELFRL